RQLLSLVAPVVPERQASPSGYTNNAPPSSSNPYTMPDVGVAADGSYDVVWVRTVSDSQKDILVERFKADGTPQAANPTVVVASLTNPLAAEDKLAVRNDGSFLVTYVGPAGGYTHTVLVRRYDRDGNPRGPAVIVPSNPSETASPVQPDVTV